MKILHLDENHPILAELLEQSGFTNHSDLVSSQSEIQKKIHNYDGIIIRSRFPINQSFLAKASKLKFIGRVGAGLENIDVEFARKNGIKLYNAPEGNCDAVAEHAMGLLLNLMNRMTKSHHEIRNGIWLREENRGEELYGKTVGLIGYGNNGKAFAKRLHCFGAKVLFYDILNNLEDEFATESTMNRIFEKSDVLSLHVPLTAKTKNLVDLCFLDRFKKNIYFLNIARGKCVITKDLVSALRLGKVKAAGLDVLEYEKSSFENHLGEKSNQDLNYLIESNKVLLTSHVAGWTQESKIKLASVIAEKILNDFEVNPKA